MNNDHEYYHQLLFLFQQLGEPKYMAGAKKYPKKMWEYTQEELEAHELEELLDMVHYRLAKILSRQNDTNG